MYTLSRFFLAAAAVLLVTGRTTVHGDMIYKNKAEWKVSWTSATGVLPLTKEQVYVFENAASRYIFEMLEQEEDSGLLQEKHILSTIVNVMDQELAVDGESILSSMIELTYIGHGEIVSLASILEQVAVRNDGKRLDGVSNSIKLFDSEASTFGEAFLDPDDPSAQVVHILRNGNSSKSSANTGLVVAVVLLSIALVAVSCVLIWAAGGFEHLWAMLKPLPTSSISTPYGFKSKKARAESTGLRSGGGIIGAVPTKSYDSENIPPNDAIVSPNRGIYREQDSQILSPVSLTSNSTVQTDTSRAPLGIRSIRKLSRFLTPEKLKTEDKHNPGFQITKMSYS